MVVRFFQCKFNDGNAGEFVARSAVRLLLSPVSTTQRRQQIAHTTQYSLSRTTRWLRRSRMFIAARMYLRPALQRSAMFPAVYARPACFAPRSDKESLGGACVLLTSLRDEGRQSSSNQLNADKSCRALDSMKAFENVARGETQNNWAAVGTRGW
jgi:hypothetical protein